MDSARQGSDRQWLIRVGLLVLGIVVVVLLLIWWAADDPHRAEAIRYPAPVTTTNGSGSAMDATSTTELAAEPMPVKMEEPVPEPTTSTTEPEAVISPPTSSKPTKTRTEATGATPTTTTNRATGGTAASASGGSGFWYRLATCESGNGAGSSNQYQFMGGTAEKVGYYPGMPLADQTEAAQGWADRLRAEGIHPGSTAGWPECWWAAGGS
jgi:cytoskeletal protein RodZ